MNENYSINCSIYISIIFNKRIRLNANVISKFYVVISNKKEIDRDKGTHNAK